MIFDWHAHYPMQVVDDLETRSTLERMRRVSGRTTFKDRIRALILNVASRLISDQDPHTGEKRITIDKLRRGHVGVVMSVLLQPFEEMDLSEPYGAPPRSRYFQPLLDQLDEVEADIAAKNRTVVRFVHDRDRLDRCLDDDAIAMVHCVEGGHALGERADEIARNCRTLADRGVAYMTVAHLFFRQVATNANALPFLPDWLYDLVFPQPASDGLTPIGEAVVRGLVANRILIDLSHMEPQAVGEVIRLLDDELDPDCRMPIVSTHAGYRFGKQRYMHDDAFLREIKRRDGVVGLISAVHQLNDGLPRAKDFKGSIDVIKAHVEKIRDATGDYRHIAIGTDFDGFVKPTMPGIGASDELAGLEAALRAEFGDEAADLITSGNSLRVLRTLWTPAPAESPA
jgi:membrane dipeptidase